MEHKHTILLVDDEIIFRQRLAQAFTERGYTVFPTSNYDEAMTIIHHSKPELAVVDLKMPGKSGLELVKDALAVHPDLLILVLTGYGSIATATEAIRLGALHYLPKPADVDDILNTFRGDSVLEASVTENNFIPPSLARAEWEHINRVLADCDGNISAAAKKLGVHRRTLQRKLYKNPPRK